MRGTTRARRDHLREKGWRVISEGKAGENGYRLQMQYGDDEPVGIQAPTRPRAYLRAETVAKASSVGANRGEQPLRMPG
jgi:hypothetical protein